MAGKRGKHGVAGIHGPLSNQLCRSYETAQTRHNNERSRLQKAMAELNSELPTRPRSGHSCSNGMGAGRRDQTGQEPD